MKIAIAQITTLPGALRENCSKIIDYMSRARELSVDLVVFPELSLCGYALMDLVFEKDFVEQNKAILQEVVNHSQNIAVILGFVDIDKNQPRPGGRPTLYNSAAIIENGKLLAIQDKSLLPNYDIFFEDRYFSPARNIKTVKLADKNVGIQICEDLWDADYPLKVTSELLKQKAEILINISASPYNLGKLKERRSYIKNLLLSAKVPFIYTNLVGVFDGYEGETIFDGQSMAFSADGQCIAQARAFEEDFLLVEPFSSKSISLPEDICENELRQALVFGIREYFKRSRAVKAYLGLSGGIDSALTAVLAAEALGRENVVGISMPSQITSDETKDDAKLLAESLGIKFIERSIVPEYQIWQEEFRKAHGKEPASIVKQNKQARLRGAILMEYSNSEPRSLVLSTGNKTEIALGYCTLYGDMCGALAVLADVSKERVYALARYINSSLGKAVIAESIINRIPSAELEPNQADRDNLPADYPLLSPLVDEIIENIRSKEELVKAYGEEVVHQTYSLINKAEFKRRQAAPGLRVTKKAFGCGRRFPLNSDWQ